jgi:Putative ABC-transporter type IV
MGPRSRVVVYGLAGLAVELAFTGLRGRPRTSAWMFPVYGLAQPLFEPAHDALRARPLPVRAAAYAAGFTSAEYASGRLLRLLRGSAPWDYSHARRHLHGLVRADYAPLWALYGLALERLHDRLAGESATGATRSLPASRS